MNAAKPAIRHDDDQIAVAHLAGHVTDDRVDVRKMTCRHPGATKIAHQLTLGQSLLLGKRRSEYRCDDDFVRAAERLRKITLKHAPARGRGSRLEEGPDSSRWFGRTHGRQRLDNRRWMVRKIVVDRDFALGAYELEPPLYSRKLRETFAQHVHRNAAVSADRYGRKRISHVVRTDKRYLERPAVAPL